MVGAPMLKAERISRSGPKLSDAQTRNFEAIKYNLDRALDDATADYLRARQRLSMLLIRIGLCLVKPDFRF